jgi:hypothetical protein
MPDGDQRAARGLKLEGFAVQRAGAIQAEPMSCGGCRLFAGLNGPGENDLARLVGYAQPAVGDQEAIYQRQFQRLAGPLPVHRPALAAGPIAQQIQPHGFQFDQWHFDASEQQRQEAHLQPRQVYIGHVARPGPRRLADPQPPDIHLRGEGQ